MKNTLALRLPEFWQRRGVFNRLLWPASLLYACASTARRGAYRRGWLHAEHPPVPVLVVGNLTVGGAGKTPLVIRLVEIFRDIGCRPGVVSRGYGGLAVREPRLVGPESNPFEMGDEPVLIARRTGMPVAVCASRNAAARLLIGQQGCNLIIADDGLQHYALARDVEIAVLDGETRLGNGWCLPAGPLRETPHRLGEVGFVVCNGGQAGRGETKMTLAATALCRVSDFQADGELSELRGCSVHAVAGIGRPGRFFSTLRELGAQLIEHPFADHHRFTAADLNFQDDLPVVMTEKDAVKCSGFAGPRHLYLRVDARLESDFVETLVNRLCHA
jgi:tetraacyldisaccharide 4'-kinase